MAHFPSAQFTTTIADELARWFTEPTKDRSGTGQPQTRGAGNNHLFCDFREGKMSQSSWSRRLVSSDRNQ